MPDASAPSSLVPKPELLAPVPSILLDLIRFLTALYVACAHLSQGYFTTGWPDTLMDTGHGAVSIFFVLSGFMMRYITTVRYGTLRRFAADRISRVYSVVLPTLALTVLLDFVSFRINPTYYLGTFGDGAIRHAAPGTASIPAFWLRGIVRVVLSLTMLSQSWFRDSPPLSNSPFWTLTYECVYYAVFGIGLYLRGTRRIVSFLILFLLIGPTVFLLLPLFYLGVAAYDLTHPEKDRARSLRFFLTMSALGLIAVHGVPYLLRQAGATWFYTGRITPQMALSAIAAAALLVPMCLYTKSIRIRQNTRFVRAIRALSAATFPLYVLHFPLFVLCAATIHYPRASLAAKLALLTFVLAVSLAVTPPCERFRLFLRAKLLPPVTKDPRPASVS